jgi:bacteriorhodopsin
MGVSGLWFFLQASRAADKRSAYLASLTVLVAGVSYYFMGFGVGVTAGWQSWQKGNTAFFWMRYVDWLLTTPMLILEICIVANVDLWEIAFIAAADIIMISAGLAAASTVGLTWPGFAASMVFFLLTMGYLGDSVLNAELDIRVTRVAFWVLLFTWCAYPLLFVLEST